MTTTIAQPARAGATNERVELARYTVTAGERVIHGNRVLGVVRLVDDPAFGEGRHFVIERELTSMAELEAIVADYQQQAAEWDVIPAASPCCLARRRGAAGMIDQDRPDRPDLTEQDLAVATLVGRYIERRALHQTPCVRDLLAVAAEFSDAAVTEL